MPYDRLRRGLWNLSCFSNVKMCKVWFSYVLFITIYYHFNPLMWYFTGDDFSIIQQEIIMMKDCKHDNIVAYFGSYLRFVQCLINNWHKLMLSSILSFINQKASLYIQLKGYWTCQFLSFTSSSSDNHISLSPLSFSQSVTL